MNSAQRQAKKYLVELVEPLLAIDPTLGYAAKHEILVGAAQTIIDRVAARLELLRTQDLHLQIIKPEAPLSPRFIVTTTEAVIEALKLDPEVASVKPALDGGASTDV
jgi:hypothetical protein